MSYNSCVCLILNYKAKDAFYKRIEQLEQDDKKIIEDFLNKCYTKYVDKDLALFYWKNYKWSLIDSGVLLIETFRKDTPEIWYKYIKLGDDERDIEIQGYYGNEKANVYLVREIAFNLGEENG